MLLSPFKYRKYYNKKKWFINVKKNLNKFQSIIKISQKFNQNF